MSDNLYISGYELRSKIGMSVLMIGDLIQRGCPCYNITSLSLVKSIADTEFPYESFYIGWSPSPGCHPDEDLAYVEEIISYRLSMVKLLVRDVIIHCDKIHGKAESKIFIERLSNRQGQLTIAEDKPLDTRKKHSYLKALAAVLCPNGVSKPLTERGLAGKIARQGERLGVGLGVDALRNIIQEVSEIIDIKP